MEALDSAPVYNPVELPHHQGGNIQPSVKTTSLKFFEEGSQVEGEDIVGEVLLESLLAMDEDLELLGNNQIQRPNRALCDAAQKWFSNFKRLRKQKVGVSNGDRIKVAVLDTWVDMGHPSIKGQIKEYRSFVKDEIDPVDKAGHGTHIAGVLLDLTTNVDLYVGEVSTTKKFEDRAPIVTVSVFQRGIPKRICLPQSEPRITLERYECNLTSS